MKEIAETRHSLGLGFQINSRRDKQAIPASGVGVLPISCPKACRFYCLLVLCGVGVKKGSKLNNNINNIMGLTMIKNNKKDET